MQQQRPAELAVEIAAAQDGRERAAADLVDLAGVVGQFARLEYAGDRAAAALFFGGAALYTEFHRESRLIPAVRGRGYGIFLIVRNPRFHF